MRRVVWLAKTESRAVGSGRIVDEIERLHSPQFTLRMTAHGTRTLLRLSLFPLPLREPSPVSSPPPLPLSSCRLSAASNWKYMRAAKTKYSFAAFSAASQ